MTAPFDAATAARRRRRMRIANVPMRALLSLPFKTPLSARLMLIEYTGRKTGKRYRQPLSYTRDGDVLLTPGGGNWTLSLADGRRVRARVAGKQVWLSPELIKDADDAGRLLHRMAELNPALTRFVPLPHKPDGSFEPEPLQNAIKHGFRVVRWRVVG